MLFLNGHFDHHLQYSRGRPVTTNHCCAHLIALWAPLILISESLLQGHYHHQLHVRTFYSLVFTWFHFLNLIFYILLIILCSWIIIFQFFSHPLGLVNLLNNKKQQKISQNLMCHHAIEPMIWVWIQILMGP